jgi:hypothetical protein
MRRILLLCIGAAVCTGREAAAGARAAARTIRLHPHLARQAAADPMFARLRDLAEFKRLIAVSTAVAR